MSKDELDRILNDYTIHAAHVLKRQDNPYSVRDLKGRIEFYTNQKIIQVLERLEGKAEDFGEEVGEAGYPETKWYKAVPLSAIQELKAEYGGNDGK